MIIAQGPVYAQTAPDRPAGDYAQILLGSMDDLKGLAITPAAQAAIDAAGLTPERFSVAGAEFVGETLADGWRSLAVELEEATGRRLHLILRIRVQRVDGRDQISETALYFNSTDRPEVRLRILPGGTFPDDYIPARTHAQAVGALETIRQSALPVADMSAQDGEGDFQLALIFLDRVSPDAQLELRGSLEPGSDLFRELSFRRLEETGWPIIAIDTFPAGARVLEVYYTPGSERPESQRTARRLAAFDVRP